MGTIMGKARRSPPSEKGRGRSRDLDEGRITATATFYQVPGDDE